MWDRQKKCVEGGAYGSKLERDWPEKFRKDAMKIPRVYNFQFT